MTFKMSAAKAPLPIERPSFPGAAGRIQTVDALRGVAALSVAWYHFTNGTANFPGPGLLRSSGTYGWVGLFIFFVLSGFVIPHALHRARFQLLNLGRYLLKRLVRLDPPYLATIALIIFLNYASAWTPGFRGTPFEFQWPQFLAHLGYANALVGYSWYNPVFWTLAVEFQWYLTAALLYPLFSSSSPWKRWLVFGACGALAYLLPSSHLLFRYLPVFALGLAAFQFRAELIRWFEYVILLITFGVISGLVLGALVGATAVGTALAISFLQLQQRWLLALGAISYSLYLLHVPIGGRIMNLGARISNSTLHEILTVCLALLGALAAAFVLWRFVERPAIRWAANLPSGVKNKN